MLNSGCCSFGANENQLYGKYIQSFIARAQHWPMDIAASAYCSYF
jgi:hypothetical protein